MAHYDNPRRHSIASYGAFSTNSLSLPSNAITGYLKQINKSIATLDPFSDNYSLEVKHIEAILKDTIRTYINNDPLYKFITYDQSVFRNFLLSDIVMYNDNYDIDQKFTKSKIFHIMLATAIMKKIFPEMIIDELNSVPSHKIVFTYPNIYTHARRYYADENSFIFRFGNKRLIVNGHKIITFDYNTYAYRPYNDQFAIAFFYYLMKATHPNATRPQLIKLTNDFIHDLYTRTLNQKKYLCIKLDDKNYGIEKICIKKNGNMHIHFTSQKAIERLKNTPIFSPENTTNKVALPLVKI